MIRTARVLVTLFFFTLVFDIAAHACGKASAVRGHQAPMNPRDARRQPGQSLAGAGRTGDDADCAGLNPRIRITTGHDRGVITSYHGRIRLTAPPYSHSLQTSQPQRSPRKALADYAVKMFGRRRSFQMRFSLNLATSAA